MGGNVRKPVAEGRGDPIPIFLSEIPQLFYNKIVKPDIAMIQVENLFISPVILTIDSYNICIYPNYTNKILITL